MFTIYLLMRFSCCELPIVNHVLTFLSLFYTSIYGVSQANMIKLGRCRTSSRKEAVFIDYINTFLVSVAASIVGYYVCKWLDRDNRQ